MVGRLGNRYIWQGGQTVNQGVQKNCAELYQTNVCPPWPETLRTPLRPSIHLSIGDVAV